MRKRVKLIIGCPLLSLVCFGQTQFSNVDLNKSSFAKEKNIFSVDKPEKKPFCGDFSLSFILSADLFPGKQNNGILSVSFPYSQKDVSSGISSSNIFNASVNDPFPNEPLGYSIGMEINAKRFFWDCLVGSFNNNANVQTGFGTNLYFALKKNNEKPACKFWAVKIALFYFYEAESKKLGSIDNYNKELSVLGKTEEPTYIYNRSNGKYLPSTKFTETAQTLDITYRESVMAILPHLSISNNPLNNWFSVRLSATYILPFYHKTFLDLQQNSTSSHPNQSSGSVQINNAAINASYNNVQFSKSPFTFDGIYFSLSFCFSLRD